MRLRIRAQHVVTPDAPITVSVTAPRLYSVRTALVLNGRRLATTGSRTERRLVISPALLRSAGTHRFSIRLTRPGGARARTLVEDFRTVACVTRFTTAFYRTVTGTGLRLRLDSRTALKGVTFKLPAGLSLRGRPAPRFVGRVRTVSRGGRAQLASLSMPAAGGTTGRLRASAKGLNVNFSKGRVTVTGLPRATGIVDLTLYHPSNQTPAAGPNGKLVFVAVPQLAP